MIAAKPGLSSKLQNRLCVSARSLRRAVFECGLPQFPRQWKGERAERSHYPKTLRAQARVERAGNKGEQSNGGPHADGAVNCLRRAFQALGHSAGDQTHAGEV